MNLYGQNSAGDWKRGDITGSKDNDVQKGSISGLGAALGMQEEDGSRSRSKGQLT